MPFSTAQCVLSGSMEIGSSSARMSEHGRPQRTRARATFNVVIEANRACILSSGGQMPALALCGRPCSDILA